MILRSLTLENIRSYQKQAIEFPAGSILLAGDIGAGKSTILLAIEFALFGATRAELPASLLLRHGEKEGTAELSFSVPGKEVTVRRSLRKGKHDISQEAGSIIINGIEQSGTAIELKAAILDILGYPKDLLAKAKNLIYRFTIYTPQEEMKRILLEPGEVRLGTLTKVFNTDKYKRIRDNAAIILRIIRDRKRTYEGMVADMEEKKQELFRQKEELLAVMERLACIAEEHRKAQDVLAEKRNALAEQEQGMERLRTARKEIELAEAELRSRLLQNSQGRRQHDALEQSIAITMKALSGKEEIDAAAVPQERAVLEKEITALEQQEQRWQKDLHQQQARFQMVQKGVSDIERLATCPTCKQEVPPEHKAALKKKEEMTIMMLRDAITKAQESAAAFGSRKTEAKASLEKLRAREVMARESILLRKQLEERTRELKEKQQELLEARKAIGAINIRKAELHTKLQGMKETEQLYIQAKEQAEAAVQSERLAAVKCEGMARTKEAGERHLAALAKEIGRKEKTKREIAALSGIEEWLTSYFLHLMYVMEKQVMASIHHEFSAYVEQWFGMMLEDESISVRLDSSFSPVIEQNGYETGFDNLSWGEKTSVALAYRLGLNKVINNLLGEVKTSELLILDEPTDGFSSEQIDRMREVLDELKTRQTILVSHDPKMESFVDHVIRIEKAGQLSRVL
ncbi:TPA: AAA family ATPase [Candidatus Woesearchaeota archaeon]|nr:AAA family ATPase [Candidatus Woesearchaeota archaeon]